VLLGIDDLDVRHVIGTRPPEATDVPQPGTASEARMGIVSS